MTNRVSRIDELQNEVARLTGVQQGHQSRIVELENEVAELRGYIKAIKELKVVVQQAPISPQYPTSPPQHTYTGDPI